MIYKTEVERAQMEIDDAIEAISILDNAIVCGFLKDEHSLIVQKWIKEYNTNIEIISHPICLYIS